MQKEIASKKLFSNLFFIYTMNVFGKTAFSAVTVALVSEAILTKTQAGIIGGMFWLFYAVGQIAGGYLTNNFSPYLLMEISLICSVISNLLMTFSDEYIPMLIIWSINGFLQFGLWPSVLRIVSTQIVQSQRIKCMDRLVYCYSYGSILSYLLTSIILLALPWKYMFISCGLVNLISAFIVSYIRNKFSPVLKPENKTPNHPETANLKLTFGIILRGGLILFCLMGLIKNITENCIKNWMPTILSETYNASESYTTFLTVILMVLNIFGVAVCDFVYRKFKRDEALTISILYVAILPLMLLLTDYGNLNIYMTTVLMSVTTMVLYGSGQFLLMDYPAAFQNYGLTALVGGITNAFAALGNVLASCGGLVADNYGWNMLFCILNTLIIICIIAAVIAIPLCRKFKVKTVS